jgi:hypothetical protein
MARKSLIAIPKEDNMSIRGLIGFRYQGIDKISYNHDGSNPEDLGRRVAHFCKVVPIAMMKRVVPNIQMVDKSSTPTHEQIEKCRPWLDKGVSSGKETEWYCLLRKTQGDLSVFFREPVCEYMLDGRESSWIDFQYIVNLDTGKLEVYAFTFDTPVLELDIETMPDHNTALAMMTEAIRAFEPEYMTVDEMMADIYSKIDIEKWMGGKGES